ncbi:hypothetical protein BDZ90DRAFT_68948 [Jaminaea rosea]|uniref:Pentacotripeptide-repeat region of PRORP domain-containing protein n=1 Tax=Jaminaea rosea TaxID=1569628 RepID=A0A316ULB1_9BASI|nr:hypothetical protein BDZ90DRAFT_68948 [Jaminaea rosea]PWN25588.1 hypothetical protein BDZ90DRAFT_68948 [Jaminaea rosea]
MAVKTSQKREACRVLHGPALNGRGLTFSMERERPLSRSLPRFPLASLRIILSLLISHQLRTMRGSTAGRVAWVIRCEAVAGPSAASSSRLSQPLPRRCPPPSYMQHRATSSSSSSSSRQETGSGNVQDPSSSSSTSAPSMPHRLYENSRAFEGPRRASKSLRLFGRRTLRAADPSTSPTTSSSSSSRSRLGDSGQADDVLLFSRLSRRESQLIGQREPDEHLRFLYTELRKAADEGRVDKCLELCRTVAVRVTEMRRAMTALPFHCILKAMVNSADVDTARRVMEDMQECGVEPSVTTWNLFLVIAVRATDDEAVQEALRGIRELPDAEDSAAVSSSSSSRGPAISYDAKTGSLLLPTRNYNATTYGILFNHYRKSKDLESALLLLAALRRSAPTSSDGNLDSTASTREAISSLLLPSTAQKLLALCIETRELGLALDLAVWLSDEVGGGERLVPPREWMSIAAESAHRAFLPGLKEGLRRAMSSLPYAPDEGFVTSALNMAASRGEVDLCHEILGLYLAALPPGALHGSSADGGAGQTAVRGQLRHLHRAHIDALVDAYSHAGRFDEALRLLAAMRHHWQLSSVDDVTAAALEFRAAKDRESLVEASDAWRRVLHFEGQRQEIPAEYREKEAPAEPAEAPHTASRKSTSYPTAPNTMAATLARDNVVALAASGRLPLSQGDEHAQQPHGDTIGLNALLRAAAKLGETDIALRLWEDAKRYNGELARRTSQPGQSREEQQQAAPHPHSIQPTIDTFNALLWSCQTRVPAPSLKLALSVYAELLQWTDEQAQRAAAGGSKEQASKRTRSRGTAAAAAGGPQRLRPNPLTFEHLISICMHPSSATTATALRRNVDAAFAWLEECKGRRLKPTKASYERLVWGVRDEEQDVVRSVEGQEKKEGRGKRVAREQRKARWEQVLHEMEFEAGYEIGGALREFLERRERRDRWIERTQS